MNRSFRQLLLTAAFAGSLSTPGTSLAQQAPASEDWVLGRFPDQDAVVAAASFDNGISLAARCSKNVFDLIISGLPEAPGSGTSRELIFLVGDETDENPYVWTAGADRTVAFSRVPALITRQLAEGGRLQIIVPAVNGGRRLRYVMTLGPSSSALEQTLSHCGRPLDDPRDDQLEGDTKGLPSGIIWVRGPRPNFPETALGTPQEGYVVTSCRVGTEGRPEQCQIESEQPAGFLLGRAVLRALDDARLGQSDEAKAAGTPFEGKVIAFTTLFRLE